MKRLFKALFFILTAAYPFIIYWGQQHVSPAVLSLFVFAMIVFRAQAIGLSSSAARWWLVVGGILVTLTFVLDQYDPLYWYPAIVNLALLLMFGHSLYAPPSAVERMARLQDPNLPDYVVEYTRKVTIVWCIFFVFNGSIAATTALYGDETIWTIYNGMIAYALIATLFVTEWLYRKHYRKKHAAP